MQPLVTILLPTHDRADVLGFAIRSVLAQTIEAFELLVVGDGCTDRTRDVVASFTDRRITWFDLPKAPFSGYANRNIALRQARGRYVAYAQHDDLWFPDHLDRLLQAIEGAEWAYSRPLWVGRRHPAIFPSPVNLSLPDEFDQFMTVGNSIPSTCVLHTQAALQRVGYWPEDVALLADWACWRTIIASGATPRVGHCRSPTCLHFPTIMNDRVSLPESALRESADSPWWPDILRIPSTDRSEQETLWRAVSEGGATWVAALRAATDAVLDHIALTTISQWRSLADQLDLARTQTAAFQAESEALRQDLAAQAADAASLRQAAERAVAEAGRACAHASAASLEARSAREALDSLHRSRSWRLTAPMRLVVSALRR